MSNYRFLPGLLFILLSSHLFSQKMLESHEWCAKKHGISPATTNITDGRSDTLDIEITRLFLDLMNVPQVKALAVLHLKSKINGLASMRFDLEGLTVDEVMDINGAILDFQQVGSALHIIFDQPLDLSETLAISIAYHGIPKQDASGWGGFYNTAGYTFNLGVGFNADPHSYGRIWFPCFDNFVERCRFETTILSPVSKPGFANGTLVSEIASSDSLWRTWHLDEPIPSYLACFAIGPYTTFRREYPGADNVMIPVEIAAAPADTNKVRTTFNKLPIALQTYEDWFGPYQWEKIGYSLVPFSSGAMEHATNVAIGRPFIDGSLNFETLWAHELSHHWWGDLATCSTAEDMWLNEGWASYCEHLFTERAYGKAAFQHAVRSNHLTILQNAHINEGGYRAVSGLPHSLTYGAHVYNKGASVAHNLRGYMGDSLFRVGCRAALAQTQFDDWSSAVFRDKLEAATGLDLHDFFDDWVFAGGYPDFSIDSFEIAFSPIDAPTKVGIVVKQKRRGAPELHENVPLEFTFLMNDGQKQYRRGMVSGESTILVFEFPAFGPAPQVVFVNTDLKLLQARSEGERWLKATGSQNFVDAKWNLSVNSLGGADSVFFRVEHHFSAPDEQGANPNNYAISKRYWSVYGHLPGYAFPPGFDAQATIFYDGRGQMDQLDAELFAATGPQEDSVLLLYRPGPGHPWQEWPTYTKITFSSTTDRWGQLRPTQIKPGEYTIGKGVSTLAAPERPSLGAIKVSPNPGSGNLNVVSGQPVNSVVLINAEGQTEKTWQFESAQNFVLEMNGVTAGTYWLLFSGKTGTSVQALIRQ